MQPTQTEAPGLAWGVPFALVLLSVALLPIVAPRLWHHRMGLLVGLWAAALLVAQTAAHGWVSAAAETWHALLAEYLPFVMLLLALFAAGGGILLEGGPWGRPWGNTALLAIGTVLAGVMGTTGVSMVLIHPLLRANRHRVRKVHLVVFFIILCANVGGASTPLGDPPLYLGFLRGVPFEWPFLHLTPLLLAVAVPLLAVFWVLDARLAAKDPEREPSHHLRVRGFGNVALVGVVVATVLVQGVWHPGTLVLLGQPEPIERLAGMAVFAVVTAVSLATTARAIRQHNLFTWAPMAEVAKLFAAIFITIGPVLAMLAAGRHGPLAPLVALTTHGDAPIPMVYFWLTGTLSAFLDNAPTYLTFFQLAGDDPAHLTGSLASTLRAVSAGAVFFGALTYIGNAPNLMVRSIATHRGVRMPGFFAYLAIAAILLLPLFAVVSLLFFRG